MLAQDGPSPGRRRKLRRAAVWATGLLLAWMVTVLLIQRLILFPRFATQAEPGAGRGVPGLVRLELPTPAGPVEGWLLPGHGVSAARPGPAVIFAHGNAELIDDWPPVMERYRRMGISVLLAEYRGYGRSAGSPSQAAITEDFVKFYDLLAARPEVDRRRIVFHGRSLGGGVVCALAAQRPPAALILMSTFTSVVDMARRYWVPRFLIRDPFDNLQRVRELDRPLMLVHGRRDRVVPFSHFERLRQAAPGARLVVYDDADHNDCPPDWEHFWGQVQAFLRQAQVL
jgi:fermentation-respiration switch protein FrsA (DUF1100 family)